jgi:ParB family transcriptional regulator, chromosome partitioning protein
MATIPTLVAQSLSNAQSVELALIENVAREDLGVIEEARTIAVLLDELDVTATALARRLGRSRSDLAHTVRLLELPDEAIELIDAGNLSKGHGKALLTEPDHCRRRELAKRAAEGGWSVRALEARSRAACGRTPSPLSCIPIRWRPPPSSAISSRGQLDARSRRAHIGSAIRSFSIRTPSSG